MTDSKKSGHREADREPEAGTDEVIEGEVVDSDLSDIADGELMGEVTTEIIDGTAPEFDEVSAALAQRDEFLDSLRRLQAEFENYKKRVAKQQADQMARAALSLVDKVLPVLDTLDLATEHLGDATSADGRALVAVASQLHDVLAKEGLERIDPIGEEFDPTAHEAVGHLPAEEPGRDADVGGGNGNERDSSKNGNDSAGDRVGAGPIGTANGASSGEPVVGQVMRPGYRWRGTVVRPAMVMVRG